MRDIPQKYGLLIFQLEVFIPLQLFRGAGRGGG